MVEGAVLEDSLLRLPPIEEPRPARDDDRAPAAIRFFGIPSQSLRGQPGELSRLDSQLNLGYPLYIEPTGKSIWLALVGLENIQLGGDAWLPDTGVPLPDELWKLTVGTLHRRELDSGAEVGFLLNFGSAADRPFDRGRDLMLTGVGFYNVPSGPRDAWKFSLFYSTTSQLPFPLPGIAYAWRPSEQFSVDLGVPFALRYTPNDAFRLTAAYRPLTDVVVRAEFDWSDYWGCYASYQMTTDTFWLSERENASDRLYLFDQRLALGISRSLPLGFRLDAAASYVFDRRIFQGDSFFSDRRDVIGIDPGLGFGLTLLWTR